jgi:hypothetical protein
METIKALKKLRKYIYQGKDISESDAEYYYDILEKTQTFSLMCDKGKYKLCRQNGCKIRRPSLVLTRLIKDLQSIQKYKTVVHGDLLESCKNNDYDGIQSIFDFCTDEDLFEILITIGKDYQIPLISLVLRKRFAERITIILDQCKPSEPITSKFELPPQVHSKLMKLGCYLINETRKIITKSWNHPSQNGIDKATLKEMIVQRDTNITNGTIARNEVLFKSNLKKDIVKVISAEPITSTETKFGVKLSHTLRISMIDAYMKPAIETNTGNCLECALFALKTLEKTHVAGEVMQLDRGDHAVLILNDKLVVDPWFGTMYPKTELPQKMMTYIEATSGTGTTVNICTNAQVGKFDSLYYYGLSKSGTFYITCDNESEQFAVLSLKLNKSK